MARKTNYAFERNNRAKAKAAKREAKRQAKLAARAQKAGAAAADEPPSGDAESELDRDGQSSRADGVHPPENS